MPRLLPLILAFLAWSFLDSNPDWVGEAQPVALLGLLGVSWLFAMRWGHQREEPPWEARPAVLTLLPVLIYIAWMAPAGGLTLFRDWELPPVLGSWIGLVPYLVIQFCFRYGEAGLADLHGDDRTRFAWRQTLGLFLGILPLALVAQAWESGRALLPADEAAHTAGQKVFALVLDLGLPLLVLQIVLVLIPVLLGARRAGSKWQAVAERLWDGRGKAPEIREWPTSGLIANAVAVGFGPFRKVLLSDRLLVHLNDQEVEAVLAHELAHLRRNHSLSLLLGVLGAVILVAVALQAAWPREEPGLGYSLLPLLGALVFIPASRVFEMQADLDASAHGPVLESGLVGALTLLGTHSMRFDLRHLSGPKRLAELRRCAADPSAATAWQRRARGWKWGLRALFAVGIAAVVWLGM